MTISRLIAGVVFCVLGMGAFAAAAHATETITYTYDGLGRLVRIVHTGTVNNNLQSDYEYDKADNRTRKKVTGSPNPPP